MSVESAPKRVHYLGLMLCMAAMIGLGACKEKQADNLSKRQIKAVATIGMITDIVKQVGGDRVHVDGLMGPGVDPHLYRATESDIRKLGKADIIFYNGLHLEAKLSEVLEQLNGRKRTVAVTKTIKPGQLFAPPEFDGYFDPHLWFDVTLWRETVDVIKEAFIAIDADHKAAYTQRAEALKNDLTELHDWVKTQINTIPEDNRVLVTAHDAFGYFGRAYGFQVKGLQGISTVSEAGTKDVQNLAAFIAKRKIPAMFVESSIPKRNIQAVQEAVKAKGFYVAIGGELFSDAMGNPGTEEGTYIGMIRHNVNTIVSALNKQTAQVEGDR